MQFSDHFTSWQCSGAANWVKPARERDPIYPNGFTGVLSISGSTAPSSGFGIPASSTVTANLSEGNLSSPLGPLTLTVTSNQLRGPDGLKLTVNSGTGLLTGEFVHPEEERRVRLRGAVVPNENRGAGYFLGPDSSGALEVTITPAITP
jgi:hypothetical protein